MQVNKAKHDYQLCLHLRKPVMRASNLAKPESNLVMRENSLEMLARKMVKPERIVVMMASTVEMRVSKLDWWRRSLLEGPKEMQLPRLGMASSGCKLGL